MTRAYFVGLAASLGLRVSCSEGNNRGWCDALFWWKVRVCLFMRVVVFAGVDSAWCSDGDAVGGVVAVSLSANIAGCCD